jgi:phosphoglycerol transferase MdoB-like AlkP superfamily enzyme
VDVIVLVSDHLSIFNITSEKNESFLKDDNGIRLQTYQECISHELKVWE